jgi:hypothetical protein
MGGHSYRFYCQVTCVQRARDKLALRFHIYRDKQADEVRILHTISRRHVSRESRIFI